MSDGRTAHAASGGGSRFLLICATIVVLAASLALVSCAGSTSSKSGVFHNAYMTMPSQGVVALMHLSNLTGKITTAAQTPVVVGSTPTGLVLNSAKTFLYVADSGTNKVATYSVAGDGTLAQTSSLVATGSGPRSILIDPSGKFLLVANTYSSTVSVFSIATSTGALTEVPGSPFIAGSSPADMKITPSGKFVYVSNPNSGKVITYSLDASGTLLQVGSPASAGAGASALAIDPGGSFLFVTNTTDNTVSAFTINSSTGALTTVPGSPFTTTKGKGTGEAPHALAVDATSSFLFTANEGTSDLTGFLISSTGRLTMISGYPVTVGTAPVFVVIDDAHSYLYVGNQSTSNVSVFSFDAKDGTVFETGDSPFTVLNAPGFMILP